MDFNNSTALSSDRLESLFLGALSDWSVGSVVTRVRYSRGADFSGRCLYLQRRIFVNLGRHLRFPYALQTNLARVQSMRNGWRRDLYTLTLADGYQLVFFIFLHELYHLLVHKAGRNTRQKESMCDRFAARHLVDRFGCAVTQADGRPVPRSAWDFQDLDGFVAAARRREDGLQEAAARTRLPGSRCPSGAERLETTT